MIARTCFALLISLGLYSCVSTQKTTQVAYNEKPFVTLKSGKTDSISLDPVPYGNPISFKSGFKSFGGPQNVAIVGDGTFHWGNTGKHNFCPQIIDGRLNVYMKTKVETFSNSSGGRSTSHSYFYYFSKKGSAIVQKANYKNLHPIVSNIPNLSKNLNTYHTVNIITRVTGGVGLAGFIGGGYVVYKAFSDASKTETDISGAQLITGGAMLAGGFTTYLVSHLINRNNKNRMLNVIIGYNARPQIGAKR